MSIWVNIALFIFKHLYWLSSGGRWMLLWPLMWAAGCNAGLEILMDLDSMCNSNKYIKQKKDMKRPISSFYLSYQILDSWFLIILIQALYTDTHALGTVHKWWCYNISIYDSWQSWFSSPDLHSRSCSCFSMGATGGTTLFTPKMGWCLEVFNIFLCDMLQYTRLLNI